MMRFAKLSNANYKTGKKAAMFYEKNGFQRGRARKLVVVGKRIIYKYPKNTIFNLIPSSRPVKSATVSKAPVAKSP